jgi:hypothetical protein
MVEGKRAPRRRNVLSLSTFRCRPQGHGGHSEGSNIRLCHFARQRTAFGRTPRRIQPQCVMTVIHQSAQHPELTSKPPSGQRETSAELTWRILSATTSVTSPMAVIVRAVTEASGVTESSDPRQRPSAVPETAGPPPPTVGARSRSAEQHHPNGLTTAPTRRASLPEW